MCRFFIGLAVCKISSSRGNTCNQKKQPKIFPMTGGSFKKNYLVNFRYLLSLENSFVLTLVINRTTTKM